MDLKDSGIDNMIEILRPSSTSLSDPELKVWRPVEMVVLHRGFQGEALSWKGLITFTPYY